MPSHWSSTAEGVSGTGSYLEPLSANDRTVFSRSWVLRRTEEMWGGPRAMRQHLQRVCRWMDGSPRRQSQPRSAEQAFQLIAAAQQGATIERPRHDHPRQPDAGNLDGWADAFSGRLWPLGLVSNATSALFHQRAKLAKQDRAGDLGQPVPLHAELEANVADRGAPTGLRDFKRPLECRFLIVHSAKHRGDCDCQP